MGVTPPALHCGGVGLFAAIFCSSFAKGFSLQSLTHPGDYNIQMKVYDMMKLDAAYRKQQIQLMPQPNRLQEMFDKVSGATSKMLISKDFFSTIKCPVLVMAGNHDQFLNTERVVNASKMIPKGELAIIPNASHGAFLEQFATVWAASQAFIMATSNNN